MKMFIPFLVLSILALGCSQTNLSGSSSSPPAAPSPAIRSKAFVDMLKEKAADLAEADLTRFNVADAAYKAKVQLHTQDLPMGETGIYIKMYRHFTGYEVRDIYRSDSLIYPIAYAIRFYYEIVATAPQHMDLPGAEEKAKRDNEFKVVSKHSITRYYACDDDGDYAGNLPEVPARPNYYTRFQGIDPEPGAVRPNPLPPAAVNVGVQGGTLDGVPPIRPMPGPPR